MRILSSSTLFAVSASMSLSVAIADDPTKKDMADFKIYSEIKWRDGPPSLPKGAMMAVLEGDPTKEGPFVFRIKVPDGYRVPPHTHPKIERVTVISGTFNIGMGDAFNEKATKIMPAGAFGYWPAGMKHFVWAKGETVLQFHGIGPWSIKYVNPDDDPRNQKKSANKPLKSGPQAGQSLPGPFSPVIVTGHDAGKRSDLTEYHGANPVALIFARQVSDPLTSLVQKIDAETARNKGARMGSFVVFLSDDEKLERGLEALAKKEGIKNTILALDSPAGPRHYKLAKDADITVILYVRQKIVANHMFKTGELNAEAIDAIFADVPKLLPAK
jgi:quercetin dioxygenase-like cupin family protein